MLNEDIINELKYISRESDSVYKQTKIRKILDDSKDYEDFVLKASTIITHVKLYKSCKRDIFQVVFNLFYEEDFDINKKKSLAYFLLLNTSSYKDYIELIFNISKESLKINSNEFYTYTLIHELLKNSYYFISKNESYSKDILSISKNYINGTQDKTYRDSIISDLIEISADYTRPTILENISDIVENYMDENIENRKDTTILILESLKKHVSFFRQELLFDLAAENFERADISDSFKIYIIGKLTESFKYLPFTRQPQLRAKINRVMFYYKKMAKDRVNQDDRVQELFFMDKMIKNISFFPDHKNSVLNLAFDIIKNSQELDYLKSYLIADIIDNIKFFKEESEEIFKLSFSVVNKLRNDDLDYTINILNKLIAAQDYFPEHIDDITFLHDQLSEAVKKPTFNEYGDEIHPLKHNHTWRKKVKEITKHHRTKKYR